LRPQEQPQPQQAVVPLIGSDKPNKLRQKKKNTKRGNNNNAASFNPLQAFAHNMLIHQGCPPPPPPTSSSSTTTTTTNNYCGDICYVLTTDAASDLHSVAIGTTSQPTFHWHDPTTFWHVGICNSKSQCVSSVNPFDGNHDFDNLMTALTNVERECGKSVGMASMFVLAKAMEPPAWLKKK
jgi:hypothetical protein